MQIYLKIFLILFAHLFSPSEHETYVSITEIMAKENEALEISIELIAHDFEYAYKKEMNKSIKSIFKEKKEYYGYDEIKTYLDNHFSISQKDSKTELKIIGNEVKLDGSLLIYIEGKYKKNIKYIRVNNDLLVNWLPNQQNIVNLDGFIKSSFTFNKNKKSYVFQ
jgi:hypothetical protein